MTEDKQEKPTVICKLTSISLIGCVRAAPPRVDRHTQCPRNDVLQHNQFTPGSRDTVPGSIQSKTLVSDPQGMRSTR